MQAVQKQVTHFQNQASEVAIYSQQFAQERLAQTREQLDLIMQRLSKAAADMQVMANSRLDGTKESFDKLKLQAGELAREAGKRFEAYAAAAEKAYETRVPEETRKQIATAVQKAKEVIDSLVKRIDEIYKAAREQGFKAVEGASGQLNAWVGEAQHNVLSLANTHLMPRIEDAKVALDKYAPEGKQKMEEGYAALTSSHNATQKRVGDFAVCMWEAALLLAQAAATTGRDIVVHQVAKGMTHPKEPAPSPAGEDATDAHAPLNNVAEQKELTDAAGDHKQEAATTNGHDAKPVQAKSTGKTKPAAKKFVELKPAEVPYTRSVANGEHLNECSSEDSAPKSPSAPATS